MTDPAPETTVEAFPHLERAPISEVICGLIFPAVAGLDAFEFGVYWDERRGEFPERRLQPALTEGVTFNFSGVQPLRAWFISPDDGELLQQIQADRFYMNWRKRGKEYPHFSDPDDGSRGLKSITLSEFERFVEFCGRRDTVEGRPNPTKVELAKIDVLGRGTEWNDLQDLAALLPITAAFIDLGTSERINIAVQVQEAFDDGVLTVRINSTNDPGGSVVAVRVETRIGMALGGRALDAAFTEGNERLNRMFFRLVPEATERFGRKE